MSAAPPSHQGLWLAAALLLGWLLSLVSLLSANLLLMPWWLLSLCVLLRTQLHTGLFIIGHDAMHRVLWPGRIGINDRLGALVLALYAGLPYGRCARHHRQHHRHPGTAQDPDFALDRCLGPVGWYRQFLLGYLSLPQMGWLLGLWTLLALAFSGRNSTAALNVLLFCTLPLVLSSVQLFVFGTYLPHRVQQAPWHQQQPTSLLWPSWLSLLTCYHFGYHREHHNQPSLPWFELPAARHASKPTSVGLKA